MRSLPLPGFTIAAVPEVNRGWGFHSPEVKDMAPSKKRHRPASPLSSTWPTAFNTNVPNAYSFGGVTPSSSITESSFNVRINAIRNGSSLSRIDQKDRTSLITDVASQLALPQHHHILQKMVHPRHNIQSAEMS
jgi:hypothetical protein